MKTNNNGWIRIHRKMTEWGWYDDPITKSVFLDLLIRASHNEYVWHGITIQRGQVVNGYPAMASRLGISVQSARTSIKRLKSTGELTVKLTAKFSLITLSNYSKYQGDENQTNSQTNSQSNSQSTVNQQSTNNNQELKELKELREGEGEKEKVKEKKRGEFGMVQIADSHYLMLCKEYGGRFVDRVIKKLDYYLADGKEKKYKNHYLALRQWLPRDAGWQGKRCYSDMRNADYDSPEEYEKYVQDVID